MTVREYLETLSNNENVTFVKMEAEKDDTSPFMNEVYKTTPVRTVWEWKEATSILDYIVVNKDHAPIDVTGNWSNWYKKGMLKCCMITTKETIYQLYPSKEQAERMIKYYEKSVK